VPAVWRFIRAGCPAPQLLLQHGPGNPTQTFNIVRAVGASGRSDIAENLTDLGAPVLVMEPLTFK
jgi:hypothetical protein